MCVRSLDFFWFHIYVSKTIKVRMKFSTCIVLKKEVIVPMQEELLNIIFLFNK